MGRASYQNHHNIQTRLHTAATDHERAVIHNVRLILREAAREKGCYALEVKLSEAFKELRMLLRQRKGIE